MSAKRRIFIDLKGGRLACDQEDLKKAAVVMGGLMLLWRCRWVVPFVAGAPYMHRIMLALI